MNKETKYKYLDNEFQYVGAQQDEDIDLGLKDDLDDDYSDEDGDEDTFENFTKRNEERERQKKINQTMDLRNA